MHTLSHRVFESLQYILSQPLLWLGRGLRIVPSEWVCSVERVLSRVLGERPLSLLDNTLFFTALMDRSQKHLVDNVIVHSNMALRFYYDFADYAHRGIVLHGLHGVACTIAACLRPGSVLFDIGANIGTVTVPAAMRLRGSGFVHAFEPNPKARQLLIENLSLNQVEATVVPNPVSDEEIETDFYFERGDTGGGRLAREPHIGRKVSRAEKVTTTDVVRLGSVTLSSYIARLPMSERSQWYAIVIKIDVQGEELRVLNGAKKFLTDEKRPTLVIVETMQINMPDVLVLLRACGFRLVKEVMMGLFSSMENPDVSRRFDDLHFIKNVVARKDGHFDWS